MSMTPAKLRKACDKVGGVYAMARLLGKGHPPQYLYRRVNRKVAISEMDALAIRKAIELASERELRCPRRTTLATSLSFQPRRGPSRHAARGVAGCKGRDERLRRPCTRRPRPVRRGAIGPDGRGQEQRKEGICE